MFSIALNKSALCDLPWVALFILYQFGTSAVAISQGRSENPKSGLPQDYRYSSASSPLELLAELTMDLYTCGHDDDPYKRMCFPGSGFTGKTWSCCQSAKFQQSGGFFTIIHMLSSYYKKRVFIHKFLCCCRLCIFSTFCWVIILYLHCSTNQEIVERKVTQRETNIIRDECSSKAQT